MAFIIKPLVTEKMTKITDKSSVEKCLDELRMGVKGQSNPVIAGSLRNSFGARPRGSTRRG